MPLQCNESVVSQSHFVVQVTEQSAQAGVAIEGKSYIEADVSKNSEMR